MKIAWDGVGTRRFETGLDHGVLYFYDAKNAVSTGVPWNGLISVDDTTIGGGVEPVYLDGVKYLNRRLPSEYSGKISAFTYPDEFDRFNGVSTSPSGIMFHNQTARETFGLSYRTLVGNDVKSLSLGYKIHLLYNLMAVQDNKTYKTMEESVNPESFGWAISSIPEAFSGYRPTGHIVLDSTKLSVTLMAQIESILYGSDTQAPRLPTVAEFNGWL